MNVVDIICFIGSICSIIGVPIALWQSISAKSKAKAAETAVRSVMSKKQLSIFSGIIESGHKVENVLNTQRGKTTPKFGKRLNATTKAIDEFISIVNEKKHNITPQSKSSKIDDSLAIINNCRENFNDDYYYLNSCIESILKQTQNIISIVSEEKQEKEYGD